MKIDHLIRQFMPPIPKENSAHSFTEGSESHHYQKPIDAGMIQELQPDFKEVMDSEPYETEVEKILYNMGKLAGRSEAITIVMNMLKENPNVDGLEILKKL